MIELKSDVIDPKTIPNVIMEVILSLILHWVQASARVADVNFSTYEQIHRLELGTVLLINEFYIVLKIPG